MHGNIALVLPLRIFWGQPIWSGIEVVITGLTRNQLYLTVPWVRIPPSPPQVHRNFNGISVGFLYTAFGLCDGDCLIEKNQKCVIMFITNRYYGEYVL